MNRLILLAVLFLVCLPVYAGIGVVEEPRWSHGGLCVDVEIDGVAGACVTVTASPACGAQAVRWESGDPNGTELVPGLVFLGWSPNGRETWSVWFPAPAVDCSYTMTLGQFDCNPLVTVAMGQPTDEDAPCAAAP